MPMDILASYADLSRYGIDCDVGNFWDQHTRKVMGLMAKSKTFAMDVVGNPVWQKVGEHFLTSTLQDYWVSIVFRSGT